MTSTTSSAHAARLVCLEGLLAAGFEESTTGSGDTTLVREFELQATDGRRIEDHIEVTVGPDFPYARPQVRSVFAATGSNWHREPSGGLCLWPYDNSVADLPWKNPEALVARIQKWLQSSADGWKGDMPILDLERYVGVTSERFMIPSSEIELRDHGYFNVKHTKGYRSHYEMGAYVSRPPVGNDRKRRGHASIYGSAVDLGEMESPFASWMELSHLLPGPWAQRLANFIRMGILHVLVVKYSREGHSGSTILRVGTKNQKPDILGALVPVPTSHAVRMMRAGSDAAALSDKTVAVVGVGAVGSHVADLLIRRGVGHVQLVDPEDLRPGNAVRHLIADGELELDSKTDAVQARLQSYGFVRDGAVTSSQGAISTVEAASNLMKEVDLVVDTTAAGECSALLSDLAEDFATPVVAAVLQRDGGVYRIDRYPGTGHYSAIERLRPPSTTLLLETGCADPISPATPDSVVEASIWTVRVVVDRLLDAAKFGPTVIGVTDIQPDAPFDRLGIVVS